MLKKIKYLLFLLLISLIFIPNVNAKEAVNLYLFWGDGCPHCAAEKEYLTKLEKEFDNLKVTKYEVWHNRENDTFLKKVLSQTNNTFTGVPVTIVGETTIKGFSLETEKEIRRAVTYYSAHKHRDVVAEIKNGTYTDTPALKEKSFDQSEQKLSEKTTILLPFIKEIDLKNYDLLTSVPILSLLTTLTISTLWLLFVLVTVINIEKDNKSRIKLLSLGLLIFTIASIFKLTTKLTLLTWPSKIIVLLTCIWLSLSIIQRQNLNKYLKIVLILLFSLSLGLLITPNYFEVLETLTTITPTKLIPMIGFFISYLIANFFVVGVYQLLWNKVSTKISNYLEIGVFVLTMVLILFI